jgi:hypothetical protein
MTYTPALVVFTLLLPGVLTAQASLVTIGNRQPDITGAMAEPPVYTPPTPLDRLHRLCSDAFSPSALAIHSAVAGFKHATGSVPEWGYGAEGYGRRLGWATLNNVAQTTIESGLAAALHEDTTYYRCACSGFWRRSAYALESQLMARRPDGTRTFSLARPIGAYGGALAATSLLPNRFTLSGDGLRDGTWNYALGFPVNMLREFWPEIRRGVFRKR